MKVPVLVLAGEDLTALLSQAPDWWGSGDRAWYDNLIFPLQPSDTQRVCAELGDPDPTLERVLVCGGAIFWTFDRQRYQKTRWWSRTADPVIGPRITIRTAGTMRRLAVLCGQ